MPKPIESTKGAAHALKWLEEEVAKSQQELAVLKASLDQAISDERDNPPEKDGTDFARIRSTARMNYNDAFDSHMKLLTKLKDFEKAVSPEKRDAAESITRDQAEMLAMHLIISLRTVAMNFLNKTIPDIREAKSHELAHHKCASAFTDAIRDAIKTSVAESHLPSFIGKTVEELL